MKLTIGEIAAVLGCPLPNIQENTLITGVCIDSRIAKPGDAFICLPGERVDGHDFANQAADKGADLILAGRPIPAPKAPVLYVNNVEKAFQQLAAYWRSQFKGKVIAVTGTAGKTSLKQLLAAIMQQHAMIAFTQGNLNNQLGVPLTILNTSGDEKYWILEVGISHAGDMDLLGSIVSPDFAILLNAGPGHTEGLGDKGVGWHKRRLLKYLKPDGTALINADYHGLATPKDAQDKRFNHFSAVETNSPYHIDGRSNANGLQLNMKGETLIAETPFFGAYGDELVLAAASCTWMLGCSATDIQKGLKNAHLPSQRFNLQKYENIHVFDDTYNANPFSMAKMLAAATDYAFKMNLPLYLVLGEMGELGGEAAQWHSRLGETLKGLKPRMICWKGRYSKEIMDSYVGAENRESFHIVHTAEEFDEIISEVRSSLLDIGGVVLFKGSRINKLEEYLALFKNKLNWSN